MSVSMLGTRTMNIDTYRERIFNYSNHPFYNLFIIRYLWITFALQNNNRFAQHIIAVSVALAIFNCTPRFGVYFTTIKKQTAFVIPLNFRTSTINTTHITWFHCISPVRLHCTSSNFPIYDNTTQYCCRCFPLSIVCFVSAISSEAIHRYTSIRLYVLISIRGHREHSNVLHLQRHSNALMVGLASAHIHNYTRTCVILF